MLFHWLNCLFFSLCLASVLVIHTEMDLIMRLFLILTQVIILSLSPALSAKTNFEHNIKVESCSSEKCKEEFKKLKRYSRQQIPLAQEMLGTFYYNGYGVEQDLKKARRYFYEAARWGLPNSQFKLGIMMIEGQGGEVNRSLGFTNLRHAAKKLPKANYYIAAYMLTNNPTKDDALEAKEKLELAANKGYVRANFLLAKVYESAILGQSNKEKAIKHYKKAAIKDPRAKLKLASLGIDLPREPENKDIERITVVREKQTMGNFITNIKNMPSMRTAVSSRIKGGKCEDSISCQSISGYENLKLFKQGATQGL